MLSPAVYDHPAPAQTSTLSLHDALPISACTVRAAARRARRARRWRGPRTTARRRGAPGDRRARGRGTARRSEEHTSELQSLTNLVCRLLLEKKKSNTDVRPVIGGRTVQP